MRSDAEMRKLIIDFANADARIRAVLLNGSKANPNIQPDRFQDFDIVYFVENVEDFKRNHDWVKVFGEIIIRQLPDEMTIGETDPIGFGYLMLFEDGNRIDLTLYPADKVKENHWPDSLTVCLLDKDNQFQRLPASNESDYFVKRPSSREFKDTSNEFWWVCTYVVKGLLRNEITYAKEMLECVVRPMLMKLIEWKIGSENEFAVACGKSGRFMSRYLSNEYYSRLLQTYSDSNIERNWKALFVMMELFEQTSNEVSSKLDFTIDKSEQKNAKKYITQKYSERKKIG
jgi:aminoglycoside 6-adenylyltransferase